MYSSLRFQTQKLTLSNAYLFISACAGDRQALYRAPYTIILLYTCYRNLMHSQRFSWHAPLSLASQDLNRYKTTLGMKINCCIDVKVYFENFCVYVHVRVRPYLPFPNIQAHILGIHCSSLGVITKRTSQATGD